MDDFVAHVKAKKNLENSSILERFLTNVLPACVDVSITTKTLNEEHGLKENDIT